jgi:2-polyprenyl-3-methyl-5-hydroxy-6-metoxy-1,4-benzoquinol methylase
MVNELRVAEHYSSKNLLNFIKKGLIKEGVDLDWVSSEDLNAVDEFHIGGITGTRFVSDKLDLSNTSKVLDIGCGLGGPARFIAETYKSSVTGIDQRDPTVASGSPSATPTGWTLRRQPSLETPRRIGQ